MSNKTELTQARVTPEVHEALTKLAEEYDVKICQVVRWAIAEYIEKAQDASDETR